MNETNDIDRHDEQSHELPDDGDCPPCDFCEEPAHVWIDGQPMCKAHVQDRYTFDKQNRLRKRE